MTPETTYLFQLTFQKAFALLPWLTLHGAELQLQRFPSRHTLLLPEGDQSTSSSHHRHNPAALSESNSTTAFYNNAALSYLLESQ